MIVKELIEPKSIVVVGGSNDTRKPGGKILQNLILGKFDGELYVVNPNDRLVQGIQSFPSCLELPEVDLAILAIPAKATPQAIKILASEKRTRAFIVLSAGFSEIGPEGKQLEDEIVSIVNSTNGTLIGPNCIGVITSHYKGVFAGPIPEYSPQGCDFVSASGATAVFILEEAITRGIKFSSIFSVGNSAQIGIEEILEYWDLTFDHNNSSKVKLIYAEQISNPKKFLKHASSLIRKGCRLAGIKAGRTESGSRAVSSHTGALAGPDEVIDALFRKAGIVRCEGRMELVYVAGVLLGKKIPGKRIAVVTHAGGPAVMLTDTLESAGLSVPKISGKYADELLAKLHHGSSVSNPIDFLATGNAEQLDLILDYVDNKFEEVDCSIVIFGTPGLFDVTDVYKVLYDRIQSSKKPIFPVLPSIVQAKGAIEFFKSLGGIYFNDEVALGKAIAKVLNTQIFPPEEIALQKKIKKVSLDNFAEFRGNFLPMPIVEEILKLSEFKLPNSVIVNSKADLKSIYPLFNKPVVMKVIGPIHKTEYGGVQLNVQTLEEAMETYERLMQIENAQTVQLQETITGLELFFGVKKFEHFGHLILFGLGGIFVEVFQDIQSGLAPLSRNECESIIQNIRSKKLLDGYRNLPKVNKQSLLEFLQMISNFIQVYPEIVEMDINPAIANNDKIIIVDARIKI
ncbi:MAG: acetate--CoA ligase family protein [Candidatus Kapaibacteriales bacterium]